MSKIFTAVVLMSFINVSFAADQIYEHLFDTKKKVRLGLWYNGIKKDKKDKSKLNKKEKSLPLEIEKPLNEFDF